MKSYLSLKERLFIQEKIKEKVPVARIARQLSRPSSTILDEVNRNGRREKYCAQEAHKKASMCTTFSEEEKNLIKEKISQGISLHKLRKELRCGFGKIKEFLEENNIQSPYNLTLRSVADKLQGLEHHIQLIYELLEEKNGKNN